MRHPGSGAIVHVEADPEGTGEVQLMVPPLLAIGVMVTAGVLSCACMPAEHSAVVPPFTPLQVQVHGPRPITSEIFPIAQKFVVGPDVTVGCPLKIPQVPLPMNTIVSVQLPVIVPVVYVLPVIEPPQSPLKLAVCPISGLTVKLTALP